MKIANIAYNRIIIIIIIENSNFKVLFSNMLIFNVYVVACVFYGTNVANVNATLLLIETVANKIELQWP